jgi:hypothetical protein
VICVYRSIEARSCNECCSGKAISIIYFECSSVALGIQHAPYCHLCPAPLYNNFPYYLINDMVFERTLLNIKCVLRFSLRLSSGIFFIQRRNERDMIKTVYWSSCKVPFILVRLSWNLNSPNTFSKNRPLQNFMTVGQVGAKLFLADRRTDGRTGMKLIVTFRHFANARIK